ncbi:MAG: class I tRNA ligase family protein [Nanoarchaeota archaeon]|nr:class I tRNA ligase family protein [Nanoarchaeota archaeon]
MVYDFKKIETKWQSKWEKKKVFEVSPDAAGTKKKKKFYVLEMFPYPSAAGLHMGHALNYTIGDIYARFKRMQGMNVLYPMGYDAFGLPAENAAIKAGEHPRKYTENSIKNFVNQQHKLGLSYDWSKMIVTSKPEYYKWNQYFFLKLYEKGLIYRKKSPVNWCGKCETVLANEQVHGGCCWRHPETPVEIKQLEQWFIKTTNYADELLDKVDKLYWPERIKLMQKNWIGRSEGTEILFEIENSNKLSNVVIVHGCPSAEKAEYSQEKRTYDKHWIPWIKKKLEERKIKVFSPLMPEAWKADYYNWKKEFEKNKIDENSVLIGHSCGCAFLVRWLGDTKKKIKKLILVAPWKIAKSGNAPKDFYDYNIDLGIKDRVGEVIIFTANNEEADGKKSVKIFHDSLGGEIIELKNHGHYTIYDMGTGEFPELLNEIIGNEKWSIFTTRPDTIYGVTFMVVSAQHPRLMELVSNKQKKEVEKFLKKLKGVSEKQLEELDKEGVFTGSYAVNPVNNKKVPVYAGNFVVADYGSGMVMAVPAHDQRDYLFARKYNIEIKAVIQPREGEIDFTKESKAYTGEGWLINSDEFDEVESEKAKEEITKFLIKKKLGRKVVNFKLRDWLVSRQRYWGTPIPVVYCDKCGIIPIKESDLPIVLPEKVKFGKGNPLKTNEKWINVKCPSCNGKAKRETDTMDTFFDSSWYYLRYLDSENSKKPFEIDKVKYWMPVDQYIGGAEHATMHLIYARFFTKALRDLDLIPEIDEPFIKLFNQGLLHGADGQKMSKSLGNVINPLDIIKKYGADSLRLALMSLASPENDTLWDENVLVGSFKFLNKVYDYFQNVKIVKKSDAKIESKLNKIIKEMTNQIENFKYNLAIIKVRELFNSLPLETDRLVLEKGLKLLSLFCPHIAEEMWEKIGGVGLISSSEWPKVEEAKINESLEKQEQDVAKLVEDINHVVKIIKEREGKEVSKCWVYVLPNEKKNFVDSVDELKKRTGLDIKVYAVNDKDKYDPDGKSKKVKPGKPGIYLE